jgi:hypothetical protein
VLVENLRRLAERIVKGRTARHDGDALANELLGPNRLPDLYSDISDLRP